MPTHGELLSSGNPFWFANEELLTDLLRDEIRLVTQLFAENPDLSEFFDLPEGNVQQRAACFALLAHCKLMSEIYETFAGRQEQSPSLGDEEEDVLRRTQNLFAGDAPAWVLATNEVVELLPSRLCDALPEPLRAGGFGFSRDNPERMQAIQSARDVLSRVEEVQALTARVFDQQLQRLEGRWAAARPVTNVIREIIVQGREPTKRTGRKTRDKQRMFRDKLIAEISDVAPTPVEFVKLMDERRVQPQPTWRGWPGSWSQAYRDLRLRKLIHQDKSRALARVQRERHR